MIRKLIPVGQGAFYYEHFYECEAGRKVSVIYDCGAERITILKKRIEQNFTENEKIDALIISHFHKDHINGIPYLIKKCDVKQIYIPLIDSEERELLSIDLSINGSDDFCVQFARNPRKALDDLPKGNEVRLIQVKPYIGLEDVEDINEMDNDEREQIIPSGVDLTGHIVGSTNTFNEKFIKEWVYIPYNFKQSNRKKLLMENLEKSFGTKMSVHDVKDIFKQKEIKKEQWDKVKEAYTELHPSLNEDSMTVYSGPKRGTKLNGSRWYGHIMICHRRSCYCNLFHKKMGCLYMGDFNASNKWKDLETAYKGYWDKIGCLQIPHHGSTYNFSDEFLKLDCFFFISAGCMNKYGHPDDKVIMKLIKYGSCFKVITEKELSSVEMVIH